MKHENHTPVGAFKIRGGLVYMDWLRTVVPAGSTVVASTRGNHGQSIGVAARLNGLRAVIVAPRGNSLEKNAAMRAQGAELIEYGEDFQEAGEHCTRLAEENGWHRVPSVHRLLVAGVATGTLEMLSACPEIRTLYVPAGMGSGVCAAMAVRDGLGLETEIVGVGSSLARATAVSLKAGRVIEAESTTMLADGVSCRRPDAGAVTAMCRGLARFVEVDDVGVAEAMRIYFADTHNVAEGAGAIGLAALLKEIREGVVKDGVVGTVLCGGNVDSDVFGRVLAGGCA